MREPDKLLPTFPAPAESGEKLQECVWETALHKVASGGFAPAETPRSAVTGAFAARAKAAALMMATAIVVMSLVTPAAVMAAAAQPGSSPTKMSKAAPEPLPVSQKVTLGPAPTGADASILVAENGLFIDLRTDEDLKEKGYVPTLGLHRQRLPIAELDDARKSSNLLRDMLRGAGDRPVWIGCNSGNRAALAWALLQVKEGTAPEAALATVDRLATYEPFREAILQR